MSNQIQSLLNQILLYISLPDPPPTTPLSFQSDITNCACYASLILSLSSPITNISGFIYFYDIHNTTTPVYSLPITYIAGSVYAEVFNISNYKVKIALTLAANPAGGPLGIYALLKKDH